MKNKNVFRSRTILYCFAATTMMIMGVASVTPILPTLTRHFGVQPCDANLIIISFTVPGLLVTPLAGVIADRWGSKRVMVPSLFLFSLGGIACAFAPDFDIFLICRFVQGMGSGALGVLSLTIISDSFENHEMRIKALGYNNSIISIANATIPLLAGALAEISWHLPLLLSGSGFPLALLIWFTMRMPPYASTEPELSLGGYLKATGKAISQPTVRYLLLFTTINFIVIFGPLVTFYPELADQRFRADPFEIGLVLSALSVGTMLVTSQISRILDHISSRTAILIGFAAFGAGLLAMPLMPGLLWGIVPIFIMGLGQGIVAPTMMGCLIARTPYAQRSGVLAANGTLVRLAQSLGPLMFGFVYTGMSIEWIFYIGGTISLLTCILIYRNMPISSECSN